MLSIRKKIQGVANSKDKNNILSQDQETNLLNNLNSPKRFGEGGADMLQALSINHQKDILGIKLKSPQLINKLRLPNHS
jgi:hypothetical protein